MASSLLMLLDDIATILDDVALMTKTAAKQTAGVLGDDLALNAQQVSGVKANRELPVVWGVAKGSLVNKAILVPAALLISGFAPAMIIPLLMIGGLFLCFEGVEKLAHKLLHGKAEREKHEAELEHALLDPTVDLVQLEKDKIKGAIRTDFILSAEIIVISLGTVEHEPLKMQAAVLVGIALLMTVGVYGLVAGIVKIDDLGLYLTHKRNAVARGVGRFLLAAAPYLMKFLTIAGTAAMFLVGGGILVHGFEELHTLVGEGAIADAGAALHHAIEHAGTWADGIHAAFGWLLPQLCNAGIGVVAGALVLGVVTLVQKLFKRKPKPA